MTKSPFTLVRTLALTALLSAAPACGPGDGPTGNPSAGTYRAALAACYAYCDTLLASCATPLIYPTVDQCKATECSSLPSETAACYAASETMWDCRRVQPTICTAIGCDSELAATV